MSVFRLKGIRYELLISGPFIGAAVLLFMRNLDAEPYRSYLQAGMALSAGFLVYTIRCLLHRFRYDLPLILLIIFGLMLFIDCQVLSGMLSAELAGPLMPPLLLGLRILSMVFVIAAVGGLYLNRLERRKRSGHT